MEAEKSYDLLSAGWGPRKVGGIVPVQIERPENQENQWCPMEKQPASLWHNSYVLPQNSEVREFLQNPPSTHAYTT